MKKSNQGKKNGMQVDQNGEYRFLVVIVNSSEKIEMILLHIKGAWILEQIFLGPFSDLIENILLKKKLKMVKFGSLKIVMNSPKICS